MTNTLLLLSSPRGAASLCTRIRLPMHWGSIRHRFG
jgi:hypothetical protein